MKKTLIFCTILAAAFAAVSCSSKEAAQPADVLANETIRTIMNRKSVRSFTDEPVPAEYMEVMLKAAMASPSGSNIQPWHFVVLNDRSQFERIFEGNSNMRIFQTAASIVVFCGDTTVTRIPRDNPDAGPVVRPNATWRDDMGSCTENFLLAAESLGLGAVWTTIHPYPERSLPVRNALELPNNVVPYCAVALGYPAADEQPKDKWKPERIHYDRW